MNYVTYLAYSQELDLYYIGVKSFSSYHKFETYKTSIKKFPAFKESLTWKRILRYHPDKESAYSYEVFLHNYHQVDTNPKFANRSKQTSKRFFFSATGEDHPQYGKDSPFKGRKHTKEAREKQSKARKAAQARGCYDHVNYSKVHKGRKLSSQAKHNISKAKRGTNNPMHGCTGSKNPAHDPTIFTWVNKKLGLKETCTTYELRRKYNLTPSELSQVKTGKRKSHKGWSLYSND